MPIYALDGVEPELPEDGQFWIAPTAVLIGKVRLLRNASVWFGAVLRGDNDWISIGENSNVQDNSIIHTDAGMPVSIGPNVTIGHNVILHSASVAANSLIGMGSTLLNHVAVGTHCLIGANALVPEGREIPDGSLVLGAPGRIVRTLTEAEKESIDKSAEGYVRNHRRFRDGLKQVR